MNTSKVAGLKSICYTDYMPKGLRGFQKGHKINQGKKYSKERRENISKALTGRTISEEWRRNLSTSHVGNRHTEESKRKISEGMKGKSTAWLTGRKLSEHQKEKLRQALVGRTVSADTRRKIGDAQRGEKGNNWKGGLTPKNMQVRNSAEYKEWRKAVYERDSYTCQLCGQVGGALNADHIKPFAHYIELRLELSNGRTLCEPCHKETDTFGGKARCKTPQ